MTVNKSQGSTRLKDPITGNEAEVGTKGTGENALHVISQIESFNLSANPGVAVFDGSKYKVEFSRSDISLTNSGNGTQIFNYIGAGLLEAFVPHVEDKDTDILLYIDGVLRYEIDCRVFEDMIYKYEKHGEYPTVYINDQGIFKHYGKHPIKFNTSFEIRAKASGKKIKEYVVNFYED